MTPTNKLRFVKRKAPGRTMESGTGYYLSEVLEVRILQQWWETASGGTVNLGWGGEMAIGKVTGEWRDIPLEEEA